MNIALRTEGAIAVALLTGAIDGKSAPQVQIELSPTIESFEKIILDLSEVSYLSSAGLRLLLLLHRQATAKEGKITLIGLSEEIADTMSMTGFSNFFDIADSLEAGLKALN